MKIEELLDKSTLNVKMRTKLEALIDLYNKHIDELVVHETNVDHFESLTLAEPANEEFLRQLKFSKDMAKKKSKYIEIIKDHIVKEVEKLGKAD